MIVHCEINGKSMKLDTAPATTLHALLTKTVGLHGTKGSCEKGYCGNCLVMKDNLVVSSCMVPAFSLHNSRIVTIEGFIETEDYKDIEKGFHRSGMNPCGTCASSKVFSAQLCLQYDLDPDEQVVRDSISGIHCRCTSESAFIRGILFAAEFRRRRIARHG